MGYGNGAHQASPKVLYRYADLQCICNAHLGEFKLQPFLLACGFLLIMDQTMLLTVAYILKAAKLNVTRVAQ